MAELNGADINKAKSAANAVSDTVKHITFAAPAYVSITRASEPVLGAFASKTEVNKTTAPIKGNAGVYVMQIINKDKSAETFDAKTARYSNSFISDLYKKAEVKDDRYLYF